MRKRFTAWITKYALTKGIFSVEVEDCFCINEKMVSQIGAEYQTCYHKPDWHRTEEEAKNRAEEMRTKRLVSLRKQVKKLEALTFTETKS